MKKWKREENASARQCSAFLRVYDGGKKETTTRRRERQQRAKGKRRAPGRMTSSSAN